MKITKAEPILTGGDVFVRIETDAGIVGYGDATNSFLPYSVEGMLKDVIPYLIGEDPERIEYLWQACFRRRFYRGGPSTGAALAGIDQALWDIKGKAYGVPVYQLLGGLARTKVRVYGHVSGNTAEEASRQAKQRVARGITAIRFRAFHSYDAQDLHDHKLAVRQQIEYLAAIREAVGDDIDLILECHGRYDPEWAIKLAETYYIDLIPHNNAGPLGSAATLHAALAIPNVTMIEAPWVNSDSEGDVVRPYPAVEKGFALPLEGPGLGVTFDEMLAKAKPFRKPGLQPRLNAPDGSVRDF